MVKSETGFDIVRCIENLLNVDIKSLGKVSDLVKGFIDRVTKALDFRVFAVGFYNKKFEAIVFSSIYSAGKSDREIAKVKVSGPEALSIIEHAERDTLECRDVRFGDLSLGRCGIAGFKYNSKPCGLVIFPCTGDGDWGLKERLFRVVVKVLSLKLEFFLYRKEDILYQRQKSMFNALLKEIPDAIYFKDKESRFTVISDYHARRLGLRKPMEAIGKTDMDFYSKDFAKKAMKDEQRILKGGRKLINKEEKVVKDGKERWVSATKVPIKGKNGKIIGLAGISRDITRIKRMEEELRKEKEKFEKVFYSNPEPMVYADENYNIVEVNDRFLELFGFSRDEVIGKNLDELIVPPGYEEEAKMLNERASEGYIYFDAYRRRKDGKLIPVSISGSSIFDKGKVVGRIAIYKDISLRVRAENINISLYEISRAVYSVSSLKKFFAQIHKSILRIIDTKNIFFGLVSRNGYLRIPYFVDVKETYKGFRYEGSRTLSERVIKTGKVIHMRRENIVREVKEGTLVIYRTLPEAYVGIPLKVKKEVIGIMVLQDYNNPDAFGEGDIRLLESISVQIAVAIDRKRYEREREKLVGELTKALNEVKKLSGLLPICANCKRIRDDQGYWNEVEKYIAEHADVDFTHSICPDCMKKLYPDLYEKMYGEGKKE